MLLQFEVSNHRSIREPVELSMIAMDNDRAPARQLDGLDEKVLTVAAVYGPNGSGKTNVLDALAWVSRAVAVSLRSWEGSVPVDPFTFGSGPPEPSCFGIESMVDGVRYRYELEIGEACVVREALYSHPERRRRTVFERDRDRLAFRRGTRLTGGGRELVTPTTLVLSVAGRLTQEINAVSRSLSDIDFVGVWPRAFMAEDAWLYRPYVRWPAHGWDDFLVDVFDEAPQRSPSDLGNESKTGSRQHRELVLAMLKFADLGVRDVEVADGPIGRSGSVRRVRLLHDVAGDPRPLELGQESNGTLTWLGMVPELLASLENGGLMVIDELDASLHPMISARLVELFQDPATNPRRAQIIFTTHDTSLLGTLNRDEVWLTSKRGDGSTELTPLSDFRSTSVRRSTNLERGYLQGRFGGVPVVDECVVREALAAVAPD